MAVHDEAATRATTEARALALVRTLCATGQARALRRERGLSLGEVAAALGTSPAVLARWETAKARPRKAAALAYAQLLAELVTDLEGKS